MAKLEELPNQETTTSGQQTEVATEDGEQPEDISDVMLPPKKVVVIDGMAVVHAMGKPTWIKTCANWADHFNCNIGKQGERVRGDPFGV